MSVALSQPPLPSQLSPSFGDGRKFSEVEQAVLLDHTPHKTRIAPAQTCSLKRPQHQMWPAGNAAPESKLACAGPPRHSGNWSAGKGRPTSARRLHQL